MPGDTINLGMVGMGKIADDQHRPAIEANSRFRLLATADPHAAVDGITAYTEMSTMLAAEPEINAVSICTPPAIRAGLAQQALAAGLHVLLEKPPATEPAGLNELVKEAGRRGVSLYTAWHSRESAAVDAARDWLADKRIETATVTWKEDVRHWHPGQEWLLGKHGFGVFDPAINAFSILTRILPETVTMESAELVIPENRQSPVTAKVLMRHGASVPIRAELDILHTGVQQWDIVIATNGGRLELSRGGHCLAIDGDIVSEAEDDEYPRIYARFAELIDRGESDVDGSPLALVCDALEQGHTTIGRGFDF